MSLSQELVLAFLLERGGRVKNCDLLSEFRGFLSSSEPAERSTNRDLFKTFINNVAVVKQTDGVKYVVLKKKYKEVKLDSSRPSSSLDSSSLTRTRTSFSKHESDSELNNNNHSYFTMSPNTSCCSSHSESFSKKKQLHGADAGMTYLTSNQGESLTARVLNVPNNSRKGPSGAVFAVVAVKSPPTLQSKGEKVHIEMVKPIHKTPRDLSFGFPSSLYPTYPSGHLYRSQRSKKRCLSSPALKRATKPSFETKDLPVVPLEPREHDWLVKSATARWAQVYSLLLQDVHLVEKRSFISGFTVLHWAAKKGNVKMMRQILDISRQSGLEVDVNAKSHDGYTPLHLAAIHNHESVLKALVHSYGANQNIRDNSGKKPYHYLNKDSSAEVREMLGDPHVLHQPAENIVEHILDVPKGFNTFTKLFQPNVGQKKKPRHRSSFHLITDEDREEIKRNYNTLSRRPLY